MKALPSPELVESYWVLPGQLLAGEYPARSERPDAAGRIDALLDAGIDTFFDLTEPEELTLVPRAASRARSPAANPGRASPLPDGRLWPSSARHHARTARRPRCCPGRRALRLSALPGRRWTHRHGGRLLPCSPRPSREKRPSGRSGGIGAPILRADTFPFRRRPPSRCSLSWTGPSPAGPAEDELA